MNASGFPQTDSIRELARFWDRHDLTDFVDQLEAVGEPVFDRAAKFTLWLQSDEAEALRRMAESRGIEPAELLHECVRERICG